MFDTFVDRAWEKSLQLKQQHWSSITDLIDMKITIMFGIFVLRSAQHVENAYANYGPVPDSGNGS
eukprot:gene19908-7025_t